KRLNSVTRLAVYASAMNFFLMARRPFQLSRFKAICVPNMFPDLPAIFCIGEVEVQTVLAEPDSWSACLISILAQTSRHGKRPPHWRSQQFCINSASVPAVYR